MKHVRYHSLDALRASMMLLGVVLHSMASYTPEPMSDAWPFKDAETSGVFALPMFLIHLFRMPAFFAVAGFFAALLVERDGDRGFIRNRTKRVLLPLVIFWATVGPLVLGAFYFAITRGGRMTGAQLIESVPLSRELANPSPMHLWFLWYLVIYYAATVAVVRSTPGLSISRTAAARITTSWWSLPLWAAITALTLLPLRNPWIDASPLLFPDPGPIIAYGVFFIYGWLLYRGRDRLDDLAQWWSFRALGAAAVGAALLFVADRTAMALLIWTLVLSTFGLFLHYVRGGHPRVRYLSDASYWIYVIHLPVVVFVAGVLARATLPAGVKFAIVLAATSAVCLATYALFVRRTWIGRLLNGPPRSLAPTAL